MDAEFDNELLRFIRSRPVPQFKPIPHYSRAGDKLEVWWEDGGPNDFGYADQVNEWLTVMRANSDHRPIGVKIFGVRLLVQPE